MNRGNSKASSRRMQRNPSRKTHWLCDDYPFFLLGLPTPLTRLTGLVRAVFPVSLEELPDF
jgi:hypothetical protein